MGVGEGSGGTVGSGEGVAEVRAGGSKGGRAKIFPGVREIIRIRTRISHGINATLIYFIILLYTTQ